MDPPRHSPARPGALSWAQADRITEYAAVGIDEFIFSGYPHLEELYWFDEGVLPILRSRGVVDAGAGSGPASAIPFDLGSVSRSQRCA